MERSTGREQDVPWRIAQAHKTAFAFGDARLKVSTVHSFKGWEAGRVILILPFKSAPAQTAGLVYVGLTRSRGDLVLVGRTSEYRLDRVGGVRELPASADRALAARFDELLSEAATPSAPRRLDRPAQSPNDQDRLDLWPPGWSDWEPDDR